MDKEPIFLPGAGIRIAIVVASVVFMHYWAKFVWGLFF